MSGLKINSLQNKNHKGWHGRFYESLSRTAWEIAPDQSSTGPDEIHFLRKDFHKSQTWNSGPIKTKRISGNQEKKREPIIGIANFTDNKCKSDRRPPPDWCQSGREDRRLFDHQTIRPFDHQTIRPTPSPGFAFGTDWARLQERRERFLCSYIWLVNNSGRNRLLISMVNV